MKKFFEKDNPRLDRFLEILPGLFSWTVLSSPLWASFFIPEIVAYFVLGFDIFWFYRSATGAFTATLSHLKMRAAEKYDWLSDCQKLGNWQKVHHIIIIPNVNEPLHILERNLESLKSQDFPKKNLIVVLAMEKRVRDAKERAEHLLKKFEGVFGYLYYTLHPIIEGEVIGKSSNEAFAGKWIKKKLVDEKGMDIDFITITTSDSDSCFHRKYFSYLTYQFLTNKDRYRRFWQAAIMFYNNIWKIPPPARIVNATGTIAQLAKLSRKDRIINFSTYSTSLKMLDEVGYWDVDVIPEDFRIFFKSFFKLKGEVEVEPIFLPIYQDAAESTSTWKTLVNNYKQQQRWAWGTSDDPLFIKFWFTHPEIPFFNKTIRVFKALMEHFLWPVNWFIIVLGATLPPLVNPAFKKTVLGQNLPRMSSYILTSCLIFLVVLLIIDTQQRPPRPKKASFFRKAFTYLEWLFSPLSSFFLNALPGLDAHTRLMLGKYLEYRVTEKV